MSRNFIKLEEVADKIRKQGYIVFIQISKKEVTK